ncbi:ImmA/IrrE family metallo-endopeptidase [Salinispora arenicola]|uniref:ImmA/IrrE family metallo-endopeptidase n=1 Tax=Salinispora arenicola TaxID=168697 RepID=UPI0002F3E7BC|nr:ImmA/IrrE family metallo-endopeptidase [Salinispora arenicola]MCN0178457.1 ImmA/IrrE family metallo-endopeptidase [Salinispora arenicola]
MATIASSRQRPIILVPTDTTATGVCGLWVTTTTTDYIAYERHTSLAHQDHIILHELGHILCGHTGDPVDTWADARGLHNDWHEQQAEAFAVEMMLRLRHAPVTSYDPAVDRVLTALDPGGTHADAERPRARRRRWPLHLLRPRHTPR